MPFAPPRFETYRSRIKHLRGSLEKPDILCKTFLLGRDGKLAVYYAPLTSMNPKARIIIVGLTPGWTQTKIAYERCRAELKRGSTDAQALKSVSRDAPFAGMRTRLCGWLDALGVARWLDVDSSLTLFDANRSMLQATSLIRYPVFVGESGENYRGAGRRPINSDLLWSIIDSVFAPQLDKLPDALVVPLGVAVAGALRDLGVPASRCLYGFPHPSGAYPYGQRDFLRDRSAMRKVVARLPK